MNIKNLQQAACIYERLQAIKNSLKRIDLYFNSDAEDEAPFSLIELSTHIDFELSDCDIDGEILQGIITTLKTSQKNLTDEVEAL